MISRLFRKRTSDYQTLPPLPPTAEEEEAFRKLSRTDAFELFAPSELKKRAGKPLTAEEIYVLRKLMRFTYRFRTIWIFLVGTFAAILAMTTTAISILEYFNLHWHL